MILSRLLWPALCAAGTLFTAAAHADVRLHHLFTDHMVLQQGKPVAVWGWADDREVVTVHFGPYQVSTTARDGRFLAYLPSLLATDQPSTLRVSGRNTVEVNDVLVGEVWICSGQSNMEWPMRASHEPENDIQNSANSRIRLFTVPKLKSPVPVTDVKANWVECTPETVRSFSAVGYYFGKDLQAARGVPVGLIHTSWGGSPAEVWIRSQVLRSDPGYVRDIVNAHAVSARSHRAAVKAWEQEKAAAMAKGESFAKGAPGAPWSPSELYNGMIAPLLPYAISGAIWYQGESNAGRAWQYRSLFADMIRNWRQDFQQGDFPFLAVQLAPWDRNKRRDLGAIAAAPVESDWAELREAQNHVAEKLKNVGIAVITDVGDKDDIHPAKKQPVGARLALLAREIAYGDKKVVSRGPMPYKMSHHKGRILMHFKHAGRGLTTSDKGELKGFAIAGDDGRFVWADAKIENGNRVVLSNPAVSNPKHVRYGWADYPVVNLMNSDGLPATPFRSDRFQVTTQPKL